MWYHSCIVLLVAYAAKGLSNPETNFLIKYFNYRDVKFVCFLTCDDYYWLHKLTKEAAKKKIIVSAALLNDEEGLLKLEKCLRQDYSSNGVIINLKCDLERVMQYASKESLFDAQHKWLLVYNGNLTNNMSTSAPRIQEPEIIGNTLQALNNLNISVDSDIVLALNTGQHEYRLYEIYNFGKIQGGDCNIKETGKWHLNNRPSTSRLKMNLNEFKYYRRFNFHRLPLRIISVVTPTRKDFDPKLLTDRRPSPNVTTITRTSSTILQVVADIHNIRLVHSFGDRWLGGFKANESQMVIASALFFKKQDLTAMLRLLPYTFDKFDVVNPPVTYVEMRYYYKIPTYGVGKFENQFLRPLSKGSWICVVVTMVLCTAVLFIAAKFERQMSSEQYALFSVLATICQQFFEEYSIQTGSTTSARKLTMFVTGLSCVLIYNYYTSSVVSWLLNGPPPSINSLEELIHSSLELIYEDIGYTRSWLQTPGYFFNKRNMKIEDEIRRKKVFNKKKNAPLFESAEDGINMVRGGAFAYHSDVDNANRLISKTFTQDDLCELGSLQSMDKTPLYISVQKNSPYKEFFSWSLMRLLERGFIRCIQLRTRSKEVKCEGSSPRALALGGAAPAFILLAGGYLLATIIMLMERVIWRYKQNHIL